MNLASRIAAGALGLAGLAGIQGCTNSSGGIDILGTAVVADLAGDLVQAGAIEYAADRQAGNFRRQNGGNTEFSTAFSYWLDKNGNDTVETEELIGASDTISLSRQKEVWFATMIEGHQGKAWEFNLYGPDKRLLAQISDRVILDRTVALATSTTEEMRRVGANGRCLVNYWVGNELVDAFYVKFTE